jgi:phosphate transport system substrate-binding protein
MSCSQSHTNGRGLTADGLSSPVRYLLPVACGTLLAICLLLSSCVASQTNTPVPTTLRIAGSTSLKPTLSELAAAYQAGHPQTVVEVLGGGTAIGIQELRGKKIDLAAVSWKEGSAKLPDDLQVIPIARDGLAIIVNPQNTITNVTSLQLRALYRGETLDWGAIGGSGGEPVMISREDGSGSRMAFESLAMEGDRVTLNALVMPTSQAVVDYVASHRNAVGYVSTGVLTDTVRAVPLEDIPPTTATVRAGEYRLGRVLYLYAPQPATPEIQAFLDFVLSPAGQAIVSRRLAPMR